MANDRTKKSRAPRTTAPKAGLGKGNDGRKGVAAPDAGKGPGGADAPADGQLLVRRRHVDWLEHEIGWRWLLDSLEGGSRYRNATYGPDRRGLPARNMFRHKREYPDPQMNPQTYQGFPSGTYVQTADGGVAAAAQATFGPMPGTAAADPAATAQDDDYEYRRSRTPVPEFVAEAIEAHLAKVYDQEVDRAGPDDLIAWWGDVDGRGTPIDDWMRETIAPLLLVLGCLDICLDHPRAPAGASVATQADVLRLGLDRCVASYILPQNMVWWRLDAAGRYVECLVREYVDPSDRMDHDDDGRPIDPDDPGEAGQDWRADYVRWRHWTATGSTLYSYDGEAVIEQVPHRFGCVPIIRLVDIPKHRTRHIGKSRYEAIAEYQREYYNRDSELILSDTLQAHPFLSGAEDYCKSDNTLSVGPGYILPMKKRPDGNGYQGWEFVSPPKDPAESLRRNKQDIIELKDRRACLAKPAGHAGNSDVVSQSGVSKKLDQAHGHKLLTAICKTLAKAERLVAEYAVAVLRNGPPTPADRAAIVVTYPARFELSNAFELLIDTANLQKVFAAAGECPEVESPILKAAVRMMLLGLSDGEYGEMDDAIDRFIASKAQLRQQMAEIGAAGYASADEALEGGGSGEQDAGNDPTGVSGGTMLSGITPITE